jgi:hypothetical protein
MAASAMLYNMRISGTIGVCSEFLVHPRRATPPRGEKMVWIPILTYFVMKRGNAGAGLTYDGRTYPNLSTFELDPKRRPPIDRDADADSDECVWPCDEFELEWHRFARDNQMQDVRVATLIFLLASCVPSLSCVLLFCSLRGLDARLWLFPVWMAFDFCAIAIYYTLRFCVRIGCPVVRRMRFRRCFAVSTRTCTRCACAWFSRRRSIVDGMTTSRVVTV